VAAVLWPLTYAWRRVTGKNGSGTQQELDQRSDNDGDGADPAAEAPFNKADEKKDLL
jgi:hypothetical protein